MSSRPRELRQQRGRFDLKMESDRGGDHHAAHSLGSVPGSKQRAEPVAVITSYSIHYTKLYDRGPSVDWSPRAAAVALQYFRKSRLEIFIVSPFSSFTYCSVMTRATLGCSVFGDTRITSYNVCYTKLLRSRPPALSSRRLARPRPRKSS